MGTRRAKRTTAEKVRLAMDEAGVAVERVDEATDGAFGDRLNASALTVTDLAAVGGLTRTHPALLIGGGM